MAQIEHGAVVADKYRLEREISHGGMGSVWLGHHLHLDVPIALKFMRTSLVENTNARSRFEREAKAAALIRSPHVVHIYDHGVDDGVPFIVMEYLVGEDLSKRLKGRRRLAPAEAVRICKEICKGLHRAHSNGIVHRDLKPGNIWLSEPDDHMVKLLDFGIAKETGEARVVTGETTTGQLLGSPHYMSPEQARGQPLDGRSDLWSLAVIMYRALSGKRPFDGQDIGDLIVRICTDRVPPITEHAPELGPQLDAFFHHAFLRSPDERFQNAREFATAFEAALSGATPRADVSASWDRISRSHDEDLGTPASTGSARFANIVGPLSSAPEARSAIGDDTLAATTGPLQKRRRLVGGVLAAIGFGVVAGVILLAPRDEPAVTTTPESGVPQAAGDGEPVPTAPPPTATASASSSAAPPPPSAPPPRQVRPPAAVPPPLPPSKPPPAKPEPKPANPFGY